MNRSALENRRSAPIGHCAGFTLIELMVALTLAAMLSVMIMKISTTAQEAYTATVRRVEVYNRFRLAMDRLRADVGGWIPSQELEYYNDGKGASSRRNFHFDPGEEVPDRADSHGKGVVDGGMPDYDEYAFIIQRHYRSLEKEQVNAGDRDPKLHDAYHMYFRTMAYADGQVREANVEYMLVDPSQPASRWVNGVPPAPREVEPDDVRDLSLYKVTRYYRIDERVVTNINDYPIERTVEELATNVTDFRLEYMTSNAFSRDRRVGGPTFVTPEEDYGKPAEPATRPTRLNLSTPGGGWRKDFGYGSVKLGTKFDLAVATPAKWGDQGLKNSGTTSEPVRIGFRSNPNMSFAEIVPGDSIYVFTQSERATQRSSANIAGALAAFPAGDYTVRANIQGMLEVVEDIDSSTWGDRDQPAVFYKAAFLPAAVRVTIRMVDDDGLNPKTMQQVIWLRRKSR